MQELRLCFPIDDIAMREALDKEFGDRVSYIEERSATGMEILIVAVVPLTALTIQIIDFILTHCVKKEGEEEPEKQQRKIEYSKSRLTLYGYTPEEAITIIKGIFT